MSGAAPVRGAEVAVLAACAAARQSEPRSVLALRLRGAGIEDAPTLLGRLEERGLLVGHEGMLRISQAGSMALIDAWGEIEAALAINPAPADAEECPSLPWLTAVETEWIEALSFNYRLAPDLLAPRLPAPLQPEVFKDAAWVQILVSSLRELRPRGVPGPAGVCFYQVSYRAAVRYRGTDGIERRGGYFLRSETNDPLMRAIGNRLAEFRFHDFGPADIVLLRDGPFLSLGIDAERPGGKLVAVVDTRTSPPPTDSVWSSLEELHEPLVDCTDAYGVDSEGGFLYTLSIERGPWRPNFAQARDLYCESFTDSTAQLDSILYIPRCPYRWLPLRRERLPSTD